MTNFVIRNCIVLTAVMSLWNGSDPAPFSMAVAAAIESQQLLSGGGCRAGWPLVRVAAIASVPAFHNQAMRLFKVPITGPL
jgi:hypothetical protein